MADDKNGDAPKDSAATHMSRTFFERIERGNNLTKMGASSHPRDTARLIAAQARACVDCPTLQVVGPQSTNQGLKAIAIARSFLKESQSTDVCMQPEFTQLEDGHTGILLMIRKKVRRTSGEGEAQTLKAAASTDARVLAGAVSSFAREGRRMVITAIGAGSINQAVKAIAIARKNIEEEAIDILCKPEFTEVNEGTTALRMLLLVEQT
uniref:Stage V sporulation protein S n=1 Tax=Calcidiscus leptoporus TaxID=127549 RepID=A0A7S0NW20_9EUKA|mmetsp:Transcript_33733/g.78942  ORF Transcript_33733/g.78942 Transcript_33733/m.78942 type:complete len:209 (+) Transcript_33733:15-641(+)|eukprot:CAMPEP_0119351826 /NCGR_PEP_ID=MMETSP1334-20130426/1118_1 /TAXON_ID=127549 /ORGANISM="Calcidiscus leptoporus, Strain RCC1130" /LENGTH=208 /DNA_ID=CAMNT_0007364707 /DNA_START=9 /DNA_END=635 /DNA_ORIENTATION=+